MIHLQEKRYDYLEEVNEGILRHFPPLAGGKKSLVLDIGCGSGALSGEIQKLGYEVWGVEKNAGAVEKAAGRITRAIQADVLEVDMVRSATGDRRFDHLVFSDVLEHFCDPFSVLAIYLSFLKKGGRLVISVPNAVVWTNRLRILFGDFRYTATGITDRTHVRFFTFNTATELVCAAGCALEFVDQTPHLARALLPLVKKIALKGEDAQGTDRRQLIDSPQYRFYMKHVYRIEYRIAGLWKKMFAFRIVVGARKL